MSASLYYGLLFLVGAIVFVLILYYLIYKPYVRQKNAKAIIGNINCVFFTDHKTSYEVMCPVSYGEVEVTQKQAKKTSNTKTVGVASAPSGHSIDKYFIIPECCYSIKWPKNKPADEQVGCQQITFIEGDPIPQISNKWDLNDPNILELRTKITSTLAGFSADQATARAMSELEHEVFQDIHAYVPNMKIIPQLRIMLVVVGIAVVIGIILTYTQGGMLNTLIQR
jgi:hypothetical protein